MRGVIIGHRYWTVAWRDHLFGPHSWRSWNPLFDMNEESIAKNEYKGIYALKTRKQVDKFLSRKNRIEIKKLWGPPHEGVVGLAVGTVKLWGKVLECTHGYRAEFAAVNTIDEIRDFGGQRITTHLAQLRQKYIRS